MISEEVREFLADAGLIVISVGAIFGIGRWFGWRHNAIITSIAALKTALDTHVADQNKRLDKFGEKIKSLERICRNGKT